MIFIQNQTNRNKTQKNSAFVAKMNIMPNVTGTQSETRDINAGLYCLYSVFPTKSHLSQCLHHQALRHTQIVTEHLKIIKYISTAQFREAKFYPLELTLLFHQNLFLYLETIVILFEPTLCRHKDPVQSYLIGLSFFAPYPCGLGEACAMAHECQVQLQSTLDTTIVVHRVF